VNVTTRKTEAIVREMIAKHGASAVILYGSQATGAATETSDWDVFALSPNVTLGQHRKDARVFSGVYLDAFIESETLYSAIKEEHLRLMGGQILHDSNEVGIRLMASVEALNRKGPPPLALADLQQIRDWLWRTFERAQGGTAVSDLRRVHLLGELLPMYFKLRGCWFLGPRTAFAVLEQKDRHAFALFQQALLPDAAPGDLQALVHLVAMGPASWALSKG
jgi:Nucleotidyltransferase domain